MKSSILLIILASSFTFGCSQKEPVSINNSEEIKQDNKVLSKETWSTYSIEEVQSKLSNPSPDYKKEGKSPDIILGKWETKRSNGKILFYYSSSETTKQKFIILPTEEDQISSVACGTYFSDNSANRNFEEAITGAEMISSAMGIQADKIRKQIHELIRSPKEEDSIVYGDLLFQKRLDKNKGLLTFSIITN